MAKPINIGKTVMKTPKPVFKTGNPYTAPRWPTIPSKLQEYMLDSLCELLSPIGEWRVQIPKSKGKRAKQLKRKHDATTNENPVQPEPVKPASPLILEYITVGYNTTVRALESQIEPPSSSTSSPLSHLAAVFLTQPSDSIQYAHLPVLAAQCTPPVALIPLQNETEARLCMALGISRMGIVGLRKDAPGASALLSLVDEVEDVQVPFLGQVEKGDWLGVKIDTLVPGGQLGR